MIEETDRNNPAKAHSDPLVTIGVPTYNRPEGLQKCLLYIEKQTYRNLEIIISDNCSTKPEVQQIIQEHIKRDFRIRQFKQVENTGLEKNFNFLFAQATAPYFIWMSDDDYFDSDYIEKCVAFLQQNRDYVLCSGVAKYYSQNNFLFAEKMFLVNQNNAFRRLLNYFSNVEKNGNFYGVFRKNLFSENPIGIHIGCDWSFMAKLAVFGKLGFVTTTNYHRSAEGNSQTRKKMIEKFGFNKFKSIFFETYTAYTISVNIFNDSRVKKEIGYLKRKLAVAIIFFQINCKLFLKFLKKVAKV